MKEVGLPVSVPEMPFPVSADGEERTFDNAGLVVLTQVRIAAETNKTVAQENAAALQARNDEVNALIECASYQNIWMEVKQEDADAKEREHFIDNVRNAGIISGLILVLVL